MEPEDVSLKRFLQASGKTIILPYDQGLEHSLRDSSDTPFAVNPLHIIKIAKKAKYKAVALCIGNTRQYFDI